MTFERPAAKITHKLYKRTFDHIVCRKEWNMPLKCLKNGFCRKQIKGQSAPSSAVSKIQGKC